MKIHNTKEKKDENIQLENKTFIFMNWWVDVITYLLISTVVLGSYKIYFLINERIFSLKILKPDYLFPTLFELLPSLYYLITMIIVHKIFLLMTEESIKKKLTPKYLESGAENEAEMYKKKVSTTFFKGFFFLFSTIFGYYVMKDLHFFPWTLLGDGAIKNFFEQGFPNFIYFDKPQYFDLYYNINFAFALFDGWILISNPLQSDFLFMILHHLVTYSLIVFSFISNYSSIGAVVYFIHYLGDIFSCIIRTSIHLDVSEKIPFVSTFAFLIVFIYTRVFIYGDLMYHFVSANYEWNAIENFLSIFLSILMMLNLLWIILITRKLVKYCITGNMEEIYKIKINKQKIN